MAALSVAAGGDDNEERDQVREAHAQIGVEADPAHLDRGLAGRVDQPMGVGIDALVLRLLRGLPEEKIRG